MAYCDFCSCDNCQTGNASCGVTHAQTSDSRWICDVCYEYDECVRAFRKQSIRQGPCESDCSHRPKLISNWVK